MTGKLNPGKSGQMLAEEEAALSQRLADGFERNLLAAAMSNLRVEDNPLRFNNFAYAIRELVRNAFERLAPDDVVRQCSLYRDETGKPNAVSRRQRVYFSVQGGLSDEYVRDELGVDIAEDHRSLRAGSVLRALARELPAPSPSRPAERSYHLVLASLAGL
jgi:hypothetical protein